MRPAWGPSALLILFSSRFCLDVDDYRVVDSDVAHAERIVHVSPVKRCADCQTCRIPFCLISVRNETDMCNPSSA